MNEFIGSKFCAIDFHVHTSASENDYKDANATPVEFIEAALKAGLDAVVITDHNTVSGIAKIKEAAKGTDLIIFPGFEINADGGHIIGIFDPNTPTETIETALINSGIDKDDWGSDKAIGHDLSSVFLAIRKKGGLALAAHIDGPKGLLTTSTQGLSKGKAFQDTNLSAVEITDLTIKEKYLKGQIYNRAIACVQGSDAHALDEIGRKYTLVKMQHLSMEGLRIAFSEPEFRIQFPEEWIPQKYPYIEHLHITKGFLGDLDIQFNPGLNCLVGGAGSGKSTIIEFIRFALDQVSSVDFIYDDCYSKLSDLAGKDAIFALTLVMENGEKILAKRKFDGLDNPMNVTRVSDHQLLDSSIISKLFPLHAYSQGEAINISRNPLAQLELIDRHLDLSQYRREINLALSELESQIPGLVNLSAKIKDRDTVEKDISLKETQIAALTKELGTLEEVQKSSVMATHHLWEAERIYLSDLVRSFKDAKSSVQDQIDGISLHPLSVPFPKEKTPNSDFLSRCKDLSTQLTQKREDTKKALLDAIEEIEQEIREDAKKWKESYLVHSAEYEKMELEDGAKRISEINRQLSDYQVEHQKLQGRRINILNAEKELKKRIERRKTLIGIVEDQQSRVYEQRKRKAKDFVKKIGSIISLELVKGDNRDNYIALASELMSGSMARKQVMTDICESITPVELANMLLNRDEEKIVEKSKISSRWAKTLIDKANANPEFIYKIQGVPTEDRLNISFGVAKGQYRSLDKLSTGQKATVIVLLAMVEGKYPIIFDQPEDALYTPFIFSEIVKTLRQEKDQRQFILATHNPNIAIAGQTDYGIVLESTSDKATIEASGGLDDKDTKDLMLLHLEGGMKAFVTRQNIFNIDSNEQ
jgi:predicted metal-dependent phosphoesterase TrpH/ABC-type lipoprotein export system ATPase subunit